MRKWIGQCIIFALILCISRHLYAADLLTVYCDAVSCDPTFKAAFANYQANKENIPITRADLLPSAVFHFDTERQRIVQEGLTQVQVINNIFVATNRKQVFYNNQVNYYLTVTQPIFNYSNWARLKQAKAIVKESQATFCAAAQDLMVRVTQAYFTVMKADADLYYLDAQRSAISRQLYDTKQRYKVGVIAETDYVEAQAAYDSIVAQEVVAKYNLANAVEQLRTITSHLYCTLYGVGHQLPLITPCPNDINVWACLATKQNFDLMAARYAVFSARDEIKVQFGGHLPVVNAFGEYSYAYDSNLVGTDQLSRVKTLQGGVTVDLPVYQGGGVNARTRQANYLYCEAVQRQEFVHRDVLACARSAFLGVFAGINSILADKKSIASGEVSLRATQAGYEAGTRTILDVLNQQTKLFNSYKKFIYDEYDYLFQTVLLKRSAGTLCVMDLQKINCWLSQNVNLEHYDAILSGEISPQIHTPEKSEDPIVDKKAAAKP